MKNKTQQLVIEEDYNDFESVNNMEQSKVKVKAKFSEQNQKLDVCPLCCVIFKMFEKKRDRLLFRAQSKLN